MGRTNIYSFAITDPNRTRQKPQRTSNQSIKPDKMPRSSAKQAAADLAPMTEEPCGSCRSAADLQIFKNNSPLVVLKLIQHLKRLANSTNLRHRAKPSLRAWALAFCFSISLVNCGLVHAQQIM